MKRAKLFRRTLMVVALVIPATLILIVTFLADYSAPAISFNGISFLGTLSWNLGNLYGSPVTVHGHEVMPGADFGILAFIVGTLFSTFLAIVFALPVAVGTAIFLAEFLPAKARRPFATLVELVAVIPSVVIGLWGIYVLCPVIGSYIGPAISAVLGFIPFFDMSSGSGSGYGLLASGIVLAMMITPIIASTLYDALQEAPRELKESAFALGATHFEVVIRTLLPTVRVTLIGSVVLAVGRALGETMAVLMVSGGALNYLPTTLFTPISTMAAFILSQLDSALEDPSGMAVRALAEIALVLFLITLVVNIMARILVRSTSNVGHG